MSPDGLERLRDDLHQMLQSGTPPKHTTSRIAYVTRTISHTISQSLVPFIPPPWPNKRLYRLSPTDVALFREQWGHAPQTVGGNFAPVAAALPNPSGLYRVGRSLTDRSTCLLVLCGMC
jgi:hypothetical protein